MRGKFSSILPLISSVSLYMIIVMLNEQLIQMKIVPPHMLQFSMVLIFLSWWSKNQTVINNPVLHARTEHKEIDLFLVHEKVMNKQLIVFHISGVRVINN